MVADSGLPSQYFLSSVYEPSTYITSTNGSDVAILTSNTTAALLFWTQNTNPDSAVDRKICTVGGSNGQSSGLCLDQWGNNVTQVAISAAGDFTGQLWNQTYDSGNVNGSKVEGWRLRSEFAGKGKWLAVAPDGINIIMSGDAAFGHTLWKYVDPAHLDSGNANGSAASSTTGSASSSTADSSSSANTGAGPESLQSHGGLSGGAIAGIVVGVVVALVAAILAFLFVRRRRRRRSTQAELSGTSSTIGRHELASDTATTTNTSSQPETAELSGQAARPRAELP